MMSNELRTKTHNSKRTVVRDGKYMTEITEYSSYFDAIERRWIDKPKKVSYKDITFNHEVDIKIIEQRSALDPQSLRNVSGYFLHTLNVKVVDPEAPVDLKVTRGQRIVISHAMGMASILSMKDLLAGKDGLKCTFSEAKRITDQEARTMFSKKEVYQFPIEILNEGMPDMDIRINVQVPELRRPQ